MKVLVVGNGAREHALAWKLQQSPLVGELFVAPGNAGTARIARNVPIPAADIERLLRFAVDTGIDFTVVGPEAPLAAGIADRFQEAGLAVFGPTRAAARIESSKSFAKGLMLRLGVPTAPARSFTSYAEARKYVQGLQPPLVVKADGLAAGKGVVVAHTREQALEALRQIMEEQQFGAAGHRVLIEEYLEGQELSAFAFVDGQRVSRLVAACDYKRALDGDQGPNTGGMGSYSPPSFWTPELEHQVRALIMVPVVQGLAAEGCPYRGVLYAGLMLTRHGPRVLEFNCRFGDPEAQVVLPRLKSDLLDVMMKSALGRLDDTRLQWDSKACVGVVVASGGYPGHYQTGYPIEGLEEVDPDVLVFHAGTKLSHAEGLAPPATVTDGGRVLTVVASGATLAEARSRAYANVARIRFQGAFYRRDIAAPATLKVVVS